MSHGKLYNQGKISAREYREAEGYDAQRRNPAFTKEARRQADRAYKELEKEFRNRDLPGHVREAERQ